MRFIEKGPSIPSELLVAQESGNLVFLCGAGVSVAAGLPGFYKLTIDVLEELGVETNTILEKQMENYEYDQVFTSLEQAYGREAIDRSVFDLLTTEEDAFSKNHQSLLTLSRGRDGHSQIITTNYDLLFEKAANDLGFDLETYQERAFPNLAQGGGLGGLVYLHGRMNDPETNAGKQNFVLSTKDFGSAYLASGVACKLLLEVVKKKHLVLVGYSGNDPVVRHLFAGLRALPDSENFRLFAFGDDDSPEATQAWSDRGVVPLVYDSSEGHEVLWESLEIWTQKVLKPGDWSHRIAEIVERGPLDALPYERGQVAAATSSRHGAREFAKLGAQASRLWLCVFDASLRRLFDLRIDSDPDPGTEGVFEDFLSISVNDPDIEDQRLSLVSNGTCQSVRLTPRLQSLRSWICSHCDDPFVMWWLSGYRHAGPDFLWDFAIEFERRKKDLGQGELRVLSLIHDTLREPTHESANFKWYGFEGLLKKYGWSPETIREFQRVTKPWVKLERNTYQEPLNQLVSGVLTPEELLNSGLISAEVIFPKSNSKIIEVPDEQLFSILKILSAHLDLASSYLGSIDRFLIREGTLHCPEDTDFYEHEHKLKYSRGITQLFDRLIENNGSEARIILSLWDENDENLQGQLVLYALRHSAKLGVTFCADQLLNMPDKVFWAPHARRELLYTLQALWNDLSSTQQTSLEERIIQGDDSYAREDQEAEEKRKAHLTASVLTYLQNNNLSLSERAQKVCRELKEGIENWHDDWAKLSDEEFHRGARAVITDDDPTGLQETPISEILTKATELSGRKGFAIDKEPFCGLVKAQPRRAYLALINGLQSDSDKVRFWNDFFRSLPDETPQKIRQAAIERTLISSDEIFSKLARPLVDFLGKHIDEFLKEKNDPLPLWHRILERFKNLPKEAHSSGFGSSFVGGRKVHQTRQSYGHAINSVAGRLIELLLSIVGSEEKPAKKRIPVIIESSIEALLSFSGEGKVATAAYMGLHSAWLFANDEQWVKKWILPLSEEGSDVREAFFNGVIHQKYIPPEGLLRSIKKELLHFTSQKGHDTWEDREISHLVFKVVCPSIYPEMQRRVFTTSECRQFLKDIGREYASEAIHAVREILKWEESSWNTVAKPFFKSIWPKELNFQTENSSRQLFYLAIAAEDDFPDRVSDFMQLFRPIVQSDMLLYEFEDEDRSIELLNKFPESVLKLVNSIVAPRGSYQPHNLLPILEGIIARDSNLAHHQDYKDLMNRA